MASSALLAEGGARVVRGNPAGRFARGVRRRPIGALGALLTLLLVFVAVFADQLAPYSPYEQNIGDRLQAPGTLSPQGNYMRFGADRLGRDVLSRTIFGARISLFVSLSAVVLGTGFGSVIGLLTGYAGGWVDDILQRFVDTLMSIPTLILALLIVSLFDAGIFLVTFAVAITQVPRTARVVRGAVQSIKENVYVEAARTIGCSGTRIAVRHILPNVTAPIIILATTGLGAAVLVEASLSFLGLGVPPPAPSWGAIISTGRPDMLDAPWLLLVPGIALSLTVLGFNLAGDALRDIWDPRLRGSR